MHAFPLEPTTADEFDAAVTQLAARLGDEAFVDAAEHGRSMRDEEVVRYALARDRRGVVGRLNHEVDGEGGGPGELGRTVAATGEG